MTWRSRRARTDRLTTLECRALVGAINSGRIRLPIFVLSPGRAPPVDLEPIAHVTRAMIDAEGNLLFDAPTLPMRMGLSLIHI